MFKKALKHPWALIKRGVKGCIMAVGGMDPHGQNRPRCGRARSSKCGQCHTVSRGTRLNTDGLVSSAQLHTRAHNCLTVVCLRLYPGRPVPEETFTHSHPSWSSDILHQLRPSTTIHSICASVGMTTSAGRQVWCVVSTPGRWRWSCERRCRLRSCCSVTSWRHRPLSTHLHRCHGTPANCRCLPTHTHTQRYIYKHQSRQSTRRLSRDRGGDLPGTSCLGILIGSRTNAVH